MKNTPFTPTIAYVFILFSIFFLSGCAFQRGVKNLIKGDLDKARTLFERSQKHPTYGIGSRLYIHRLNINKNPNTLAWIDINESLCALEPELNQLSIKKLRKLAGKGVTRGNIAKSRGNLQDRITERMAKTGTITQLLVLEEKKKCWSEGAMDTLRNIIVNRTLSPEQEVYTDGLDEDWTLSPLPKITKAELAENKSRSCGLLFEDANPWGVTYEEATAIGEYYKEVIAPYNFGIFWDIEKNIWEIFQLYHSYCEMDQFREEHPLNKAANDCSYDNARDTLCLGKLRPLLAFHRNNPHTVLDVNIVNQISCLAQYDEELINLNAKERKQVDDVIMMIELQRHLIYCESKFASASIIPNIEYLAKKYPDHQVVFHLAGEAIHYFSKKGQIEAIRATHKRLSPLYKDNNTCDFNGLCTPRSKEQWFALVDTLANRIKDTMVLAQPIVEWNTTNHDEYALVSWGETDEVFFVRRNREDGSAKILTSKLKADKWSKPKEVKELSIADDVTPLSISSFGRAMLLESGGQLMRSLRIDVGRTWAAPEPIPMTNQFGNSAWISPDDSLLLIEYYISPVKSRVEPRTDLIASRLDKTDRYNKAIPIGEPVNLPLSSEKRPIMALGGRLLFFTSDRQESLYESDMYSVYLSKPHNWSTMGEPVNLGLELNTIFKDEGISYFSEYTGMAYFHQKNKCTEDINILKFQLGPEIFPENAMRLAGLVVDESGTPIGGGFMEIMPDYQTYVYDVNISPKGTYTYTIPDSTEVVRLFPEIPGYYSEQEYTHFLANVKKGEIIRDTFQLYSFDYIRRDFKLVNSTFYNGTAEFDNPTAAFPEITRLAKIATRMGANLELTGHTDGTGGDGDNVVLSKERANSVKQFLIDKCGFPEDRIQTFGYGSSKPISSNDTEEGRKSNRRVEIVFKMPKLK